MTSAALRAGDTVGRTAPRHATPPTASAAHAPQHTENVICCLKVLSAICKVVGILELRPKRILTPQTSRPFPHIAAQIQHAIGTRPIGKTAHRACCADAGGK